MKIKSVQEILQDNSAALIISEENVKYFTGFHSSNGYLLICKNASVFLTDSRYIEAAKNQIKVCDKVAQIDSISKTLAPLIENLGIKKIHIEQSRITIQKLEMYKKYIPTAEFDTSDILDKKIMQLRRVKDEVEVEKIKQAQRITEEAFMMILDYIDDTVSEKDIALELEYYMLKNGADALSFETIVVSGKNSSMPHGTASDKLIENGDFITMDFGCVVDGYHSDMTRTVAFGSVSEKQIEVYNLVLKAQLKALQIATNNKPCSEIDKSAREIIESAGYGKNFGHGLGHGVGIEIHENPSFSPYSDEITEIGNIITVEPGVYIEGEFGVRIEDMILITENGCENLTYADKNLIVL